MYANEIILRDCFMKANLPEWVGWSGAICLRIRQMRESIGEFVKAESWKRQGIASMLATGYLSSLASYIDKTDSAFLLQNKHIWMFADSKRVRFLDEIVKGEWRVKGRVFSPTRGMPTCSQSCVPSSHSAHPKRRSWVHLWSFQPVIAEISFKQHNCRIFSVVGMRIRW